MEIYAVKGMNDIGPEDVKTWRRVEDSLRKICETCGFYEVRTPIIESAQLFNRGVGEATDIIEKEMYLLEDRNGESLALRPEATASVVRAFIEHNWLREYSQSKVFYLGPMFRYERPQKGRYRQFYQFGLEILGVDSFLADVDIISTQNLIFESLGLKNINLHLSSIGCKTCRPSYVDFIKQSLLPKKSELCEDCQRRYDKNPLRILDCKVPQCKKIADSLPKMLDRLCTACNEHLSGVKSGLDTLKIKYILDPLIVRGLDYYTRTAFEFKSVSGLGSQDTVCGGGRYDGLFESLGGDSNPSVGCAMGMERLLLLLAEKNVGEKNVGEKKYPTHCDVFLVGADEVGLKWVLETSYALRKNSIYCDFDLSGKSVKAQMKRADKVSARFSLVVGENEIKNGLLQLKNMKDGSVISIKSSELIQKLKSLLLEGESK